MRGAHAGKEELCLHFCPYYKPGKNEELACRGYVVISDMMDCGAHISLDRRGRSPDVSTEAAENLKQALCRRCPFFEQDCDFILTEGTASPCGGFRLLLLLIDEGSVRIGDIP